MTCCDVTELLSSYLDGELNSDTHNLVKEHLERCERCRRELEGVQHVKTALRSLPELEFPSRLHAQIMSAVTQTHDQKQFKNIGSSKRIWSGFKMPSIMRGKLRTASFVIAACLVIMIISSGGTLFFVNRYGFPKTTQGISEGMRNFGPMGDNIQAPSASESFESPDESYDIAQKHLIQPDLNLSSDMNDFIMANVMDVDRKLIKRANLSLEVSRGEVGPVSEQTTHVVRSNQGYIESSSMSLSQDKRKSTVFYMTARVPSENLDKAIEDISSFGEVTRSDSSVEDVTEQYVDLNARTQNKIQQEQRLLQILGNASTVGELLQVEGELSRVRADIESMEGRRALLEKSSAMSFLSLTIIEEGASQPIPSPWANIWKTFLKAWQDMFMFTAKIAPMVLVLALGYFGIRSVLQKRT